MSARAEQAYSPWLHRFAVLTSASTLLLIFVGGLVTSTGSALAVPDWPLAYGSLFPRMVGGVLYEHGHRMAAAAVGALMTALACWIFTRERRRWVGWLAAAALGAVVLQGVLGGITVLFLLPTVVSVAHACLAQLFLCLTVALAVVTGKNWMTASPDMPEISRSDASSAPDDRTLRLLTLGLTGAVYFQLILGAVMRHTGAGLAIPDFPLSFGRLVPPLSALTSSLVAINFAHRAWAACVSLLAIGTLARVALRHRERALLARPALMAAVLLGCQVALGALTVWTSKAVLPTTAHVACGAATLATSLLLCLRAHRLMRAQHAGHDGWIEAPERGVTLRQRAAAP